MVLALEIDFGEKDLWKRDGALCVGMGMSILELVHFLQSVHQILQVPKFASD